MALVIPSGHAAVALSITRGGDPTPYQVTFAVDAINYALDPPGLRDLVAEAFQESMFNQLDENSTLTNIQLRYGNTGGDPLTIDFPANIEGAGAGETLPQNSAILVSKITNRPGRTGKGRFYWPTVFEANVNGLGVLDSGYRTSLQGSFALFLAYFNDGAAGFDPAPMALLHNEGAPGGTEPTPIVGLQVASVIATQRGRLRK